MTTSLAKNYAEALFSIGVESNKIGTLQEEMKQIKELVIENGEMVSLLCSSFLPKDEKEEFIDKVFNQFDEDIVSMIKIMNKNHRVNILLDVIEAFNSMCNEKKGILEGLVYSICPLTNDQISKIEKKISSLENVPCELKNLIDSNLIGGIKVVINGHIYDGSIKSKIESMRVTLSK